MGVLRMMATGTEGDKTWRDDIGTASNNQVAEASVKGMAKNYSKGTVLQVWEKHNKKWQNHLEINGTASSDKNKSKETCAIWAKVESDQENSKEITGSDRDIVQFRVGTYKSALDGSEALKHIAEETPNNTVLELWMLDDNSHWKTVKSVKGKSKSSYGGPIQEEKEEKEGDE